MLIDPVPLFFQIFITLLVSMTTMKWTGLFLHNFYILSSTGNKPLYLKHIPCCHGNRSLKLILSKSNFSFLTAYGYCT